jgi:hypothetical protein
VPRSPRLVTGTAPEPQHDGCCIYAARNPTGVAAPGI